MKDFFNARRPHNGLTYDAYQAASTSSNRSPGSTAKHGARSTMADLTKSGRTGCSRPMRSRRGSAKLSKKSTLRSSGWCSPKTGAALRPSPYRRSGDGISKRLIQWYDDGGWRQIDDERAEALEEVVKAV